MNCPAINGLPAQNSRWSSGFFTPTLSSGKEKQIYLDRSGEQHEITEDGLYKIIHLGGGKLKFIKLGDHLHDKNTIKHLSSRSRQITFEGQYKT